MAKQIARPVTLTCGDVQYYKVRPEPGDWVICRTCGRDEQVTPVDGNQAETIVGDVKITPHYVSGSKRFRGECLICNLITVETSVLYASALENVERHQYREHTSHGATLIIEKGVRLPKNSAPPF